MVRTENSNGINFTHGQTIDMRTYFAPDGDWHYNNGMTLKNPSLFIMLPQGFELDPLSVFTSISP